MRGDRSVGTAFERLWKGLVDGKITATSVRWPHIVVDLDGPFSIYAGAPGEFVVSELTIVERLTTTMMSEVLNNLAGIDALSERYQSLYASEPETTKDLCGVTRQYLVNSRATLDWEMHRPYDDKNLFRVLVRTGPLGTNPKVADASRREEVVDLALRLAPPTSRRPSLREVWEEIRAAFRRGGGV